MAKNPYQLTQLAYDAGFRKSRNELITAVAAAIGESGGNEHALGDGGHSYGLWQIYIPAHPEYASNPTALFDPVTNANAAYKIYVAAGRSFEPFHAWSHASGVGKASLTTPALAGVSLWEASHPGAALGASVAPTPLGKAAGAVGGAAQSAGSAIAGASDVLGTAERVRAWITTPANIGRLAIGVGGLVVLIVGFAVLAKPAVETAVKTVAAVKP